MEKSFVQIVVHLMLFDTYVNYHHLFDEFSFTITAEGRFQAV